MTNTTNFKGLLVWQQAMDLVEMIYNLCRQLQKDELFALSSQLRRAAVSIASNIAEGSGRGSRKEFIQHLRIAYGSLCEIETQVLLVKRLRLTEWDWDSLVKQQASVGRLLKSLINSLKLPKIPETYATSETLETS